MNRNKGYKAIVNILNSEGTPSGSGCKWSWSTIWHMLNNEAYIGRKVWNKFDYDAGKKKKPEEEWIVSADAHQPIIDRETFYAVKTVSERRNPNGAAFKSSGPSVFILRGLLKCPMCGVTMVSGTNSRHSRYYHCGTYHRKGSKACKRNGITKEKIETAVIDALTREFSLLSFAGSLEDEVRRYVDYENRETTFQIARIDDDLKHLHRRKEMAEKEKAGGREFVHQYIIEIEDEISKLQQEKQSISQRKIEPSVSPEHLQLIRDKLKGFVAKIKILPPDEQHTLFKEYVDHIMLDQFSGNYKVKYKIPLPTDTENQINVLEKTIYFSVDLQ